MTGIIEKKGCDQLDFYKEVEKIFKGYEQKYQLKLTKIDNNEVAFIGEN
ncbi:hypothetical protein [Listeria cossartiae]